MCAAAIKFEKRQVLERVREALSEPDCDCALHRLSQTERARVIDAAIDATNAEVRVNGGYLLPSFDDDWELAPLSMTKTTERECAEYWYEQGKRAERRELQQNSDMREMFRVGNERVMK
jgi:hypothetical protein